MRKASHILLKVGGILSVVAAGCLAIASFIYLVLIILLNSGLLNEAIKNGTFKVEYSGDIRAAILILTITFIYVMVILFVFAVFNLISGILAFKADRNKTKKSYVVSIVFSVLGENYVTLAGSILGVIIAHKDENKASNAKKEEAEVIDVKDAEAK